MPPTLRAYWEDARRRTALATVTGHPHGGFTLDRALFHASDPSYQHKQPCDRGHVLADGHKLKVHKVGWERTRDGMALVHRTDGPLPGVGAKAQVHLDADRRDELARAHTVMHLVLAALLDERHELLSMPEVVGGGQVNFHAKTRDAPAEAIPRAMKRAQAELARRVDVVASFAPRDAAQRRVTHHPVGLDAIAPDEPTLRLASIGDACTMPCDAPLVENTRQVGRLLLTVPRPAREGVRWQVKVLAPE